jgi:hypothetical protein
MLTKAYGADSAKSGLSFIYRFKNGRKFMKDERIGTRQLVGRLRVWNKCGRLCVDRRFSIGIMTKEVNVDRIPGEDLNFGFMLYC